MVLSVASNLAQIICKRRLSIDSDILQSGYKQLFCSIRSNVDHANNLYGVKFKSRKIDL